VKGVSLLLILPLLGWLAWAGETVAFEDHFDGKPDSSWHWLREDPSDWRVRQNALEIRIRPGDASTVRNALVRPAPDRRRGRFAVEVTVTNLKPPKQQYEQAGITWYTDGKPVFKLVKELVDGQLMIIPGRKPMTNETVQLRLIVSSNAWTAQFRPDGEGEFQIAATGELPPPGADEVSLQCYHGSPDAEHWIRFDDFRVLKLED
jgi:regulation of enolase protein 1 (concanavalin A-like superfamily)